MPYVVALSGGIASGKSTIATLFANLGVPIVDADKIARQVVERGSTALDNIVKHFSQEILLPSGKLDRTQLREIIFNNEHERLWLNNLLHPLIQQETQRQISIQTAPYVLWVVPLLVENNLQRLADSVIIIDITPELQIKRLIGRDHIDEQLAQKMVLSQLSHQERCVYADDIIKNSDDVDNLNLQVIKLHHDYLVKFRSENK